MEEVNKKEGIAIQADVSIDEECQKTIQETVKKWGRIDALINNASTFYPTPIGTFSEESWDALMGSNLKAPLFLIQSFYEELKKNKGFIINITDINVDKA